MAGSHLPLQLNRCYAMLSVRKRRGWRHCLAFAALLVAAACSQTSGASQAQTNPATPAAHRPGHLSGRSPDRERLCRGRAEHALPGRARPTQPRLRAQSRLRDGVRHRPQDLPCDRHVPHRPAPATRRAVLRPADAVGEQQRGRQQPHPDRPADRQATRPQRARWPTPTTCTSRPTARRPSSSRRPSNGSTSGTRRRWPCEQRPGRLQRHQPRRFLRRPHLRGVHLRVQRQVGAASTCAPGR